MPGMKPVNVCRAFDLWHVVPEDWSGHAAASEAVNTEVRSFT